MHAPRSILMRWYDARVMPGLCGLAAALAALLLAASV
jgi:hypothetical protein